ncbi:Predicted PurR-regulated permease PerM [Filimonas lacunae]|uniref:Predicted PurR-regulated permease PerM n=1 Tax=Filimonas lacunae TaxID=477680 RepID=A0A173MSC7_9BACT|nr:AI-2E family transporter [Filimonas lacunae]BAV10331.1 membrane protein [Filimonas lacunae]SIT16966.1 Predicted PurR-regulated permease PerM [Filimonas lacunae]
MENHRDNKVNRYFLLAFICILGLFLFWNLIQFFTAFLGAIILYVLGKPFMCKFIKKYHWHKTWAAVLVMVVSFFIILLPIGLLVTLLYNKIASVAENPQPLIDGAKNLDHRIEQQLHISIISDKTIEKIQTVATSLVGAILGQGFNMFSLILMMYFMLYFMLEKINRLEASLLYFLPFPRDKIKLFGNELVAQTFSNSIGIPLICVIQGLLGWACYLIAGLPQPGFWAVATGFASVMPIVGASVIWAPVSLYMFATGHMWQGGFVIAWGFLVIGLSDNVVRFILAKRMADVHPIVTVLGVIMGLKLFGITGLIFGPLIISYFLLLLRIYYVEYQKPIQPHRHKPRQLMPSYFQAFLVKRKAGTSRIQKKQGDI